MQNEYKFKPCPFCGCANVDIREYDPFEGYQGNLSRYRVWCKGCGARVEQQKELDAVAAWNRRANA